MSDFIYQDILVEFKSYLNSNHSEAIYFETRRLAQSNKENIDLSYRKILKLDNFALNAVLDERKTELFTNELRSLHKVRRYETYAFDILDTLTKKSELEVRLNSIQAICSFSNFNHRHIFYDRYDDKDNFPISVKIPYHNFDMLFSKEPYEVLSNLLETLTANKENEELYLNFISYYYSTERLTQYFKDYSKASVKDNNGIAFITALLYAVTKTKIYTINFDRALLHKAVKKIFISIPDNIKNKFNIIPQFEEILEQ